MTDQTSQPDREKLPETELLICRLVDGEASEADRVRFDQLASDDPSLRAALARHEQAMEQLADALAADLSVTDHVGLPDAAAAPGGSLIFRLWPAYLGWAAALGFAVLWAMSAVREPAPRLTPVQYLEQYIEKGPLVVGPMRPIIVSVDELDDGRLRVRYLRRIEEIATIPMPESGELPINDIGELLIDPLDQHRDRGH